MDAQSTTTVLAPVKKSPETEKGSLQKRKQKDAFSNRTKHVGHVWFHYEVRLQSV